MARPVLRVLRGARTTEDADVPPPSGMEPAPPSGVESDGSRASTGGIDDAQLLAAIHGGDEDAAAELHDRLRPRVDLTIRSLLGVGHSEHDDLAQQSFIQIVLSLERYRGECSLETWAATITARTVFKYLRRRTVERRIFRESGAEDHDDLPGASSLRVGKQLVARDLSKRIRGHLEEMDAAKAEAFLLHDVCGFDAREVAGIANISEAAAHARISRGRRELHAKLAADPELRDALIDMEDEP